MVRVIARTAPDNPGSIKVLALCGSKPAQPESEAGVLTHELTDARSVGAHPADRRDMESESVAR
jgi:hypothetical protein